MGFRRLDAGHELVASFRTVRIYEVLGVVCDFSSATVVAGQLDGVTYTLGMASSLNVAGQAIFGDDLVSDEAEWAKTNDCGPPYLLLVLGPTKQHRCSSEFARTEPDGSTTAFDGFGAASEELATLSDLIVPRVLAALRIHFATPTVLARPRFVDQIMFGTLANGTVIRDSRINVQASGHVSNHATAVEIEAIFGRTVQAAPGVCRRSAKFLLLASREEDPLKRFLYFFLAIEVYTHVTFERIGRRGRFRGRIPPVLPRLTRNRIIQSREKSRRPLSLKERFLWAAHVAWLHLTDDDVEAFSSLKRVRDSIAHGSLEQPPGDAVYRVERLALRVHGAL